MAVKGLLERAQRRQPTADDLQTWLLTPRGSDGRTPLQVLEEGDFDRARYLAISTPSPGLRPIPGLAGRRVASSFRGQCEVRLAVEPLVDDEALAALLASEEDDAGEGEGEDPAVG